MTKSQKMREFFKTFKKKPKAEQKQESEVEYKAADINKDGAVDEKDLSEVHKEYAKEKKKKAPKKAPKKPAKKSDK